MKRLNFLIMGGIGFHHIGGSTAVIRDISLELLKQGHHVSLIEADRPPFKSVAHYHFFNQNQNELGQIIAVNRIINRLCAKKQFDVVILNFATTALSVFLNPQLKKSFKVYLFHGSAALEAQYGIIPPKKHQFLGKLKRHFQYTPKILFRKSLQDFGLARADLIIAFSAYTKRLLLKNFSVTSHQIKCIPAAVDSQTFKAASNLTKAKQKIHLNTHLNHLLVVSRFEKRKGIANVIQALPKILKVFPDTRLTLIFPKTETNPIQFTNISELVKKLRLTDQVQFLSGLSGNKLTPYYQGADCTIMASLYLETFGLTTLEALSCGCPVLGTATGATPEILKPLDKHLLISGTSPEQIAQAVNRFLSLPRATRLKMRSRCTRYIRQHYTWEQFLQAFLRLIHPE